MDIETVKKNREWKHTESGTLIAMPTMEEVNWLINEHDRLTSALTSAKEEIERLKAEREVVWNTARGLALRALPLLKKIKKPTVEQCEAEGHAKYFLAEKEEGFHGNAIPWLRKAESALTAERKETERLREAAKGVLAYVEGDLPCRGWLHDNDGSRAALHQLKAVLHPPQQEEQ